MKISVLPNFGRAFLAISYINSVRAAILHPVGGKRHFAAISQEAARAPLGEFSKTLSSVYMTILNIGMSLSKYTYSLLQAAFALATRAKRSTVLSPGKRWKCAIEHHRATCMRAHHAHATCTMASLRESPTPLLSQR